MKLIKPLLTSMTLGLAGFTLAGPMNKVVVPIYAYDPTVGHIVGGALFMYPETDILDIEPPLNVYHEYILVTTLGGKGDNATALEVSRSKDDAFFGANSTLNLSISNFYAQLYESNENDAEPWIEDRNNFNGNAELAKPVYGNVSLFLGAGFDWQEITGSERAVPEQAESSYGTLSAGAIYDSRNNDFAPTAGYFGKLSYLSSPVELANQDDPENTSGYLAELRAFYSFSENIQSATRFYAGNKDGNIWDFELGGDSQLRGYEGGRFVADSFQSLQQEIRFPVWNSIKGVAFVEGAEFEFQSDNYQALTSGAGLRFFLPPDQTIAVRVDLAFTDRGESNLFVNFNHAF